MNYLEIQNKAAKVKLNYQVDKFSIDQVIEEIDKTYGMKGVEDSFAIGEIVACAENAIDTLTVEIHTGGGSVFDGYRLFNSMQELRNRGVSVTARINTLAASMGSVIAMAADKIEIAANGRMMIHEASTAMAGDAKKMRQTANLLEGISDEIAAIYATKTGKTQKEMRDLMKSETWMTAKQAVEMGFADSIFDTKAKNMASILDRFKPDAALTEKVIGLEASVASAENQVTEISAQLTEVQNDFATAIAELSELKASNESITAQLTEAQALLQAEKESVTAKATEIETLNAQLIESQNSASAKAAEILASAGVPPIDANQDPLETKTLREQINALPTAQARLEATLKNWDKLNK
jgi:ATP-dependent Clp protease protease subunit